MNELRDALRVLADELEEGNDAFWRGRVAPLLPKEPLTPEFLDETLAPLHGLNRAVVLEFLARLGRREVAETAARLAASPGARGSHTLELAVALAECGDPRGLALLEALFRRSLGRPDDETLSVPLPWILDDTLGKRLRTPEALALRGRLVRLANAGRSGGN